MKGIILKDLYENFRIFKNGVSYLAAVLFLFLLIEAMQTGDLFSLKYFFKQRTGGCAGKFRQPGAGADPEILRRKGSGMR